MKTNSIAMQYRDTAIRGSRTIQGTVMVVQHTITLVLKGDICHFLKWQIPPFDTKVSVQSAILVLYLYTYQLSSSSLYVHQSDHFN